MSPTTGGAPGTVQAQATVTNTGSRTASDVAHLYLGFPASVGEPPKQLKGFQRITPDPQQSTQATFTLTPTDLRTWDTQAHTWTSTPGSYQVMVGDSSRALPSPQLTRS